MKRKWLLWLCLALMAGAGSAAPLTIRVVDAFGHPCPGIEAEVLIGGQSQGRTMTDADGCLVVEAEPSDYAIAVRAYLISDAARQCDIDGWDGSPDVVDAPLERTLCVGFTRSGRPEGVPAGDAVVRLENDWDTYNVSVPELSTRHYLLSVGVDAPEVSWQMTSPVAAMEEVKMEDVAEADFPPVDLDRYMADMPGGVGTFSFMLTAPDGTHPQGLTFSLKKEDSFAQAFADFTYQPGADGSYVMTVPQGEYCLTCTGHGVLSGVQADLDGDGTPETPCVAPPDTRFVIDGTHRVASVHHDYAQAATLEVAFSGAMPEFYPRLNFHGMSPDAEGRLTAVALPGDYRWEMYMDLYTLEFPSSQYYRSTVVSGTNHLDIDLSQLFAFRKVTIVPLPSYAYYEAEADGNEMEYVEEEGILLGCYARDGGGDGPVTATVQPSNGWPLTVEFDEAGCATASFADYHRLTVEMTSDVDAGLLGWRAYISPTEYIDGGDGLYLPDGQYNIRFSVTNYEEAALPIYGCFATATIDGGDAHLVYHYDPAKLHEVSFAFQTEDGEAVETSYIDAWVTDGTFDYALRGTNPLTLPDGDYRLDGILEYGYTADGTPIDQVKVEAAFTVAGEDLQVTATCPGLARVRFLTGGDLVGEGLSIRGVQLQRQGKSYRDTDHSATVYDNSPVAVYLPLGKYYLTGNAFTNDGGSPVYLPFGPVPFAVEAAGDTTLVFNREDYRLVTFAGADGNAFPLDQYGLALKSAGGNKLYSLHEPSPDMAFLLPDGNYIATLSRYGDAGGQDTFFSVEGEDTEVTLGYRTPQEREVTVEVRGCPERDITIILETEGFDGPVWLSPYVDGDGNATARILLADGIYPYNIPGTSVNGLLTVESDTTFTFDLSRLRRTTIFFADAEGNPEKEEEGVEGSIVLYRGGQFAKWGGVADCLLEEGTYDVWAWRTGRKPVTVQIEVEADGGRFPIRFAEEGLGGAYTVVFVSPVALPGHVTVPALSQPPLPLVVGNEEGAWTMAYCYEVPEGTYDYTFELAGGETAAGTFTVSQEEADEYRTVYVWYDHRNVAESLYPALGIEPLPQGVDNGDAPFTVSPVPADEWLHVRGNGAEGAWAFTLYAVDGTAVSAGLTDEGGNADLPVGHLRPGIYLLSLHNGLSRHVVKAIVR